MSLFFNVSLLVNMITFYYVYVRKCGYKRLIVHLSNFDYSIFNAPVAQ